MGKHLRINRLTLFVAVLAVLALVVTGLLGRSVPAHADPDRPAATPAAVHDRAALPLSVLPH